jgi:hypothetical protein
VLGDCVGTDEPLPAQSLLRSTVRGPPTAQASPPLTGGHDRRAQAQQILAPEAPL